MTFRHPLLLVFLAVACSGPGPVRPQRSAADFAAQYPGELRPAASLGQEVLWQQRVTAHWGAGEQRGFDAAVQVQAGVLTVLGLSPLGAPGFVLRLADGAITVEQRAELELPFPARFVLLDVQRAFFPWLLAELPMPHDGERSGEVDGERVTETYRDGRLIRRRFERCSGTPAGAINVDCEWGDGPALALKRATLDNGWCGYRLVIDNHRELLLPRASG
jgi:hypothetical protein